jgi:hypothetical protein
MGQLEHWVRELITVRSLGEGGSADNDAFHNQV